MYKIKELLKDENGNAAVTSTIIGIVVAAIVMALCGMIVSNIQPFVKVDENNTAAASSVKTIFDTTWSALGMAPIVLIVMIAGLIVGAVYMLQPRY